MLVRSVTTVESPWDEEQQGWMLALGEYRASRCKQCGGDLHETTDPASEGTYRPLPPIRCHRCTALIRLEEQYAKQDQRQALLHTVEHRPRRG